MLLLFFGTLLLILSQLCLGAAYSEYILAPESRTLIPLEVYGVNGSVEDAASLTKGHRGTTIFRGISSVTYDFKRNIAGLVTVDIQDVSSKDAYLGVTFSESNLWINAQACDATADAGLDSPLWFNVGHGAGNYTAEKKHNRGAFRYLTIVSNTTATISVNQVTVEFTAAPKQDLQAYTGFFHSNDELLNEIWYAGAYTNQLCTIDPAYGDALPLLGTIDSGDNITLPETTPWWSNYTITNGSSALTDGAKRDRLVWPGDMSISLESIVVSTYDLYSLRNSLESLFALQHADGRLPYAGQPFPQTTISFTYHLHSLIGVSYYYKYSGDHAWLSKYWRQFKRAIGWSLSSVDDSGMANVTASADWLRFGMGGHNIEANAILYFALNQGVELASLLGDTTAQANWSTTAQRIKSAANQHLWDDTIGLYRDNETTTSLYPQDGNSWAIKANLTTSTSQRSAISTALRSRWGKYGAPAPEAGKTVSPFIGGFETEAHFIADRAESAFDLIRLQWGFMLKDPRMTQSTFIEGYSTDGSLHYAPYTNDARISHAHGWSTGPTSILTFYAAGIQLTSAAGSTWSIAPQPGDLRIVDAGFSTNLGDFSVSFRRNESGKYTSLTFRTPVGTKGNVRLPGVDGVLTGDRGERVKLVDGVASGLGGGSWSLE
ncbi:hypothetical protein Plec18167_006134 [Paecilomyces lecythidis]|uniref:Alpha-L-rhamnosidase n=1 Tax=Paecilomyces lecythidis TaxID=3004212 RepID=A0ABR3XEU1_9EURO